VSHHLAKCGMKVSFSAFVSIVFSIPFRWGLDLNANINFCEIIASENSGEICTESTSIAWLYLQCVAFAYSLDWPIACNRGSTFKNDCRKSRLSVMCKCIAWVRMKKRTCNFDEITKSIDLTHTHTHTLARAHARTHTSTIATHCNFHCNFHWYNRLSWHVDCFADIEIFYSFV